MDNHSHLLSGSENEASASSMARFDEADFRQHLDGFDITDLQKSELMLIVWNIMRMWVEMDLPLQNCGQIFEALIDPATSESGGVK